MLLRLNEVAYKEPKLYRYLFFYVFGLFFFFLGITILLVRLESDYIVHSLIATLSLPCLLVIFFTLNNVNRWLVDFNEVGLIKIGPKEIEVKKRNIILEEIEHFTLEIFHHKEKKRTMGFPIHNYLTLVLKDGTTYEIRFEIDFNPENKFQNGSQKQFTQLKELLLSWYKYGVPISETIGSNKTYGLKTLSYKEIQEFKERYLENKNPIS